MKSITSEEEGEEGEEGEELTVLMRWGEALQAQFGSGEEELVVRSTQDVWVSILGIVRDGLADPSDAERLEVWFGGELIRERSATYADYGVQDGARLTADVAPPRLPPLVALSMGGAGTTEMVPGNDHINGKAWQVVMCGLGHSSLGGPSFSDGYASAADIREALALALKN